MRPQNLNKVKSAPIDLVILKPFKLNDFQSAVQRIMESRYGELEIMRAL